MATNVGSRKHLSRRSRLIANLIPVFRALVATATRRVPSMVTPLLVRSLKLSISPLGATVSTPSTSRLLP